ncbi:hypothetical protein BT93_I1021 [Corymbia citriodora subsp. variegata]|nr:hypothetical protein BT93_I1021 [Corymbia citriodora subsp. variegata]
METIMGKHPVEIIWSSVARNFVQVISLALACLSANPKSRPTIEQVPRAFLALKIPMIVSFHAKSLAELRPNRIGASTFSWSS